MNFTTHALVPIVAVKPGTRILDHQRKPTTVTKVRSHLLHYRGVYGTQISLETTSRHSYMRTGTGGVFVTTDK